MTFLSAPREHWKKIRWANSVERLKSEIRASDESCSLISK